MKLTNNKRLHSDKAKWIFNMKTDLPHFLLLPYRLNREFTFSTVLSFHFQFLLTSRWRSPSISKIWCNLLSSRHVFLRNPVEKAKLSNRSTYVLPVLGPLVLRAMEWSHGRANLQSSAHSCQLFCKTIRDTRARAHIFYPAP